MNRTRRNTRQVLLATSLSLGMLLGACSWIPKGVSQLDVGIEDRGLASWYGAAFHGKRAANGKRFDMEALTAAHRTLPLGSVVRIVNLANGKHLHVWITDRGPYVRNRVIDLSRAAAVRLGMMEGGVSVVRVQVVGKCWPATLLSSEVMEAVSLVLGLQQTPSVTSGPIISTLEQSNLLWVYAPLQLSHGDIWIQQRIRRSRGVPATDQPDPSIPDTEVS
jgi:rare lipoprotein A